MSFKYFSTNIDLLISFFDYASTTFLFRWSGGIYLLHFSALKMLAFSFLVPTSFMVAPVSHAAVDID